MLNRKLGRTSAHRNAMLRGLVTYLLENGSVETTLTRAKEVRSVAEKMITLGKKNTLASRRAALSYITKEDVVTKVFNEIAPNMKVVTVVTLRFISLVPAVVTELRWQSSNWLTNLIPQLAI